jgi:two-component system CheB/CheR fusion protein
VTDRARPQSEPAEHEQAGELVIVGIGASAGGLSALKTFFAGVANQPELVYVVVVHLSPQHKSHLAELLQPHSALPVRQVTQTTPLEAGHVYVIPPAANLSAIDTHLRLSDLEENRAKRAPIDHFFRTLADTHDGHSVGIVLTGTGTDGTLGLRHIKERRGLTIAQEPAEAEHDGMPRSAIASGVVDVVTRVAEMPAAIARFARTRPRLHIPEDDNDELGRDEDRLLQKVYAQIRARAGHDFGQYKKSTILRRIARRMPLYQVETLDAYLEVLRRDPQEIRSLSEDLLITVTEFFRDERVFEHLAQKVVPTLFKGKGPSGRVRVWSVGCSTGEEAYSLAMLLLEHAQKLDDPPQIQVFASDLHAGALKVAREGLYPRQIATNVSPERLERFFTLEDDHYRVKREVRELVVFAPHNLLSDPPFSHLDLLVCRNLLIYLQRDVQDDVMSLFHYALEPEGQMLLGSSETVERSDMFACLDKDVCLYRKRHVPSREPRLPAFPLTPLRHRRATSEADRGERAEAAAAEPRPTYGSIHARMVEQHAPPSLLLGPDGDVVHASARAGRYLAVPGGERTSNVYRLLREPLGVELRAAMHSVEHRSADGRPGGDQDTARDDAHEAFEPSDLVAAVCTRPVSVRLDGRERHVAMWVQASGTPELSGFTLVTFEERDPPATSDRPAAEGADPQDAATSRATIRELRTELEVSRHRLRGVVEEYETSREEMQASNEELQSANEELRSTLEELETSKEELQSMNEELATINQENRHRVEELSQMGDDLHNLFIATDIATIFLDRQLRIVRFTPKVGELFNVRQSDRGRPLSDITHTLGYPELAADARRVLEQLTPVERSVEGDGGGHFLARVLPYRASDDRIGGVVITLLDITCLKRAERALRDSEERYRLLVESAREYAMLMIDPHGLIASWNRGAERLFGYTAEEIQGRPAETIFTDEDRAQGVPEREMATARRDGQAIDDRWHQRKDGSRFWANGVLTTLDDGSANGPHRGFVKVLRDNTKQKAHQEQLETIMAELNHRVKNTLAVVQSVASQTLRGASDLKSFAQGFERRLRSMAKAHSLLSQTSWSGAELADIVAAELGVATGESTASATPSAGVDVQGPDVILRPAVALAMQMIIHELATNAHKYGCLRSADAHLSIRWEVLGGQPDGTLAFHWAEERPEPSTRPAPDASARASSTSCCPTSCTAPSRVSTASTACAASSACRSPPRRPRPPAPERTAARASPRPTSLPPPACCWSRTWPPWPWR